MTEEEFDDRLSTLFQASGADVDSAAIADAVLRRSGRGRLTRLAAIGGAGLFGCILAMLAMAASGVADLGAAVTADLSLNVSGFDIAAVILVLAVLSAGAMTVMTLSQPASEA